MNKQTIWIAGSALLIVAFIAAVFLYGNLSEGYTPNNSPSLSIPQKTEAAAGGSTPDQTEQADDQSVEQNAEQNEEAEAEEAEDYTAPDFTVYDLDGNEVKLTDNLDKPVMINFWATWCGACKMAMPAYDKAVEEYGDRINFMFLNVDESPDVIPGFMEENGYSFPVYHDKDFEASYIYGASSIPLTYFIGSDGLLLGGQRGAMSEELLFDYLDAVLEYEES